MPSFLNKVFGRRKDDKPSSSSTSHASKRRSNASLLEGKYEAVSASVSPSATKFAEAAQQPKDAGSPLDLFRSRSKNLDQSRTSSAASTPAPHLTLNLPVPKEEKSRALGVVFEADPDNISTLSDAVIGERRLNPLETLLLIKACADALIQHGGLETLGLMHPHWYSASPEVQRKLISLYIVSLQSKAQSPITTLSPTPASPSAVFSTELEYTRSPHDVAAVLRWAIRHVRLEGSSFGSTSAKDEWSWYVEFAARERDSGYAPTAFSKILVPQLPPAHLQLLIATLDIISSLAAHAEVTGTSGSKLAKLFGLWLLSAQGAKSGEDWSNFYTRWDHAGRILEHLFLARVREESLSTQMPLRLSELVKHYPYTPQTSSNEQQEGLPLLPRSPFSTRLYDALFVRIDTELPSPNSKQPSRDHPLRLISEAVKAPAAPGASISEEPNSIWEDIKKRTAEDGHAGDAYPELTRVLDDETLRLLSLVPAEVPDKSATSTPTTFTSTVTPALRIQPPRRRSSSVGAAASNGKASGNGSTSGHARDSTAPASFTNWTDFSVIGFGDTLLTKDFASTLESDMEVTSPPSTWSNSRSRGRASTLDVSPSRSAEKRGRHGAQEEVSRKALLTRVDIVPVDEAFVDFWSDALLDPISSSWPAFVVCQLKPGAWKVNLLVIEHTYTTPNPPPPPPQPTSEKRAASPRPSLSSNMSARKSFTFSPTKKRFSLFSSSHTNSEASSRTAPRKGSSRASGKSPRIGEMGEILPEEPAFQPPPVPAIPKDKVDERPSSLPVVPVVVVPPPDPVDASAPVHVEPVKTEEGARDKSLIDAPQTVPAPVDVPVPREEKALPPAPEPADVAGYTSSPHGSLSTSEPAASAQASTTTHPTTVEEDATPGSASLPEISALPELVASAPVDPPPEASDAGGAPVLAPSGSGSHVEPHSAAQSEKPGGDAAVTEPISEPEPSQDAAKTATAVPAVQGSSAAANAHEQGPEGQNQNEASKPSPSNSDDTVVGSDPGPVDNATTQPSSPPEEFIDETEEDPHAASTTVSAQANANTGAGASGNGEASQDPQATVHPDAEAEASTNMGNSPKDSREEPESRTVA